MARPNSFKLSDDDIVRLYKENRLGDWSKMIVSIARVAGATESDIVSILSRRSEELGSAPTPKMAGSTFTFIRPTARSVTLDDLLLRRVQTARNLARATISEMEEIVKLLGGVETGLREGVRSNASH